MATGNAEGEVNDNDNDKTKMVAEAEEKGKTFRKRRLSLTNLRQLDNESGDDEDNLGGDNVDELPNAAFIQTESGERQENENESDEKAHTFRKRRLSLTSNSSEAASSLISGIEEHDSQANAKRLRKSSDVSARISCSTSTRNSNDKNLQSITLHAAEISSPSPTNSSLLPKFYQQAAPPQQLSFVDKSGAKTPKWKERHVRPHAEDDMSLPFPRDIVGTFSCHGVEPIYDEDDSYLPLEDKDEGTSSVQKKLTMAAKINQDRGGVAFPYGNSTRTALFAVYDGANQNFHV